MILLHILLLIGGWSKLGYWSVGIYNIVLIVEDGAVVYPKVTLKSINISKKLLAIMKNVRAV